MFTEPTRRLAMERARDTGTPAASGLVTLVQEIDGNPQAGFLIYMPVYRTPMIPATVEERRRSLYGFVYSPFRGDDLLRSILGTPRDVGFSVYDGTSFDHAALLHTTPLAPSRSPYPPLRATTQVEVAGRQWTIVFEAPPYLDGSSLRLAPAVLFGGLLLSVALFAIMRFQLDAWETTARHAAELRASEEAQRETGERLRRLVTLEREARAEAQQADRAKDDFLATLSHELRTPLNAMLGWITMLRSGKVRQERRADALDVIERNARTQARLIEDLLDVSRIVTGKVRLDLQPLQVAPIVHTAVEAMRLAAESKRVGLHARIAMDAPAIMGDPNRMQQIIWNLLSNAIKFTPAGGKVHVELGRENDTLRLSVRDTGIGIASEFLPHVFERFRQADSSSTRAHSGVGLGLAIVRHLVQLHDGSIEAHSDGQGKGAHFVVRFPAAARAVADSGGRREQDRHATLAGVRVLVVDDDADARDLVAEALLIAGAVVRTADSAEATLAAFAQDDDVDIIVSDIGMPGVDGYELMRRIRRLPGARGRVPSIAVTAYARPGDREEAMQAGFNAHLTKPVEIDELLRTIASLVRNASAKMQPYLTGSSAERVGWAGSTRGSPRDRGLSVSSLLRPVPCVKSSRRSARARSGLRQLRLHHVVRLLDEAPDLTIGQRVPPLECDPVIARDVVGRLDVLVFDELGEFLGRALERHLRLARGQAGDGEHLAADLEDQIGPPLHVLGGVRERQTVLAQRFEIH